MDHVTPFKPSAALLASPVRHKVAMIEVNAASLSPVRQKVAMFEWTAAAEAAAAAMAAKLAPSPRSSTPRHLRAAARPAPKPGSLVRRRHEWLEQHLRQQQHQHQHQQSTKEEDPDDKNPAVVDGPAGADESSRRAMESFVKRRHESLMQQHLQHELNGDLLHPEGAPGGRSPDALKRAMESLVKRRHESLMQQHREYRSTRELVGGPSAPVDNIPAASGTVAADEALKGAMENLIEHRHRHESLMQEHQEHRSSRELLRATSAQVGNIPAASCSVGADNEALKKTESLVEHRRESLIQHQEHRSIRGLSLATSAQVGNNILAASGSVGADEALKRTGSVVRRRHEYLMQQRRGHRSTRELLRATKTSTESTVPVILSESREMESRNDRQLLTKTFHQNRRKETREPAEQLLLSSEADTIMMAIDNSALYFI